MNALPRNQIIVGDALSRLQALPPNSVDMVLTSPPYFRLRNYQMEGQLGLEASIEDWVEHLRTVLHEVERVIVPTGTVWLNLGDSYSDANQRGARAKSLLLGPERLALELSRDGWTIRNKIIWAKTNAMPSSVSDRLSSTYEVIYLLTKNRHYFFDLGAIRVPHRSNAPPQRRPPRDFLPEAWRGPGGDKASGLSALKAAGVPGHPLGKNPGDVWHIATANYRGAHFATFPTALAARAISAGCPELRCKECRAPHTRIVRRAIGHTAIRGDLTTTCHCAGDKEPGLVLDPFMGAGTTALVAESLGREWLGFELNPAFAKLAGDRIRGTPPSSQAA